MASVNETKASLLKTPKALPRVLLSGAKKRRQAMPADTKSRFLACPGGALGLTQRFLAGPGDRGDDCVRAWVPAGNTVVRQDRRHSRPRREGKAPPEVWPI